MIGPFTDYINRDNESKAALETRQANGYCSLSLFQKYNISYQKCFEDDEKHIMRIIHEMTEDFERHPARQFYDKVVLHSSSTKSYGVDPNMIERPLATTTVEAELLFLDRKPSSPPCFENKLDKTITASRNKKS